MIKKVLLIAAFIIFAVSCGGSPTDSTQGGSNNKITAVIQEMEVILTPQILIKYLNS